MLRTVILVCCVAAGLSSGQDAGSSAVVRAEHMDCMSIGAASGDLVLHGTLTHPATADARGAVVLLHGSGPQDRDSTVDSGVPGRPLKPLRDLAVKFAEYGFFVYRYDKRTFNATEIPNVEKLLVTDFAIDAAAAATCVIDRTKLPASSVALMGHSQGASLAPTVSALFREMSPSGDALGNIAMLMGHSAGIDVLMVDQLRRMGQDGLARRHEKYFHEVRLDRDDSDPDLYPAYLGPFWRSWFAVTDYAGLEHAVAREQVHGVDVAAINSEQDWNVPPWAYAEIKGFMPTNRHLELNDIHHLLCPLTADIRLALRVCSRVLHSLLSWLGADPSDLDGDKCSMVHWPEEVVEAEN
ncbi:MAG: hypothetical protein MHM6MM_000459 [Cercozoa sp. M6MM]